MRIAPLERILIGTDSPMVYQGEKSEPADLVIAPRVKPDQGIPPGEVTRITAASKDSFYRHFAE